MHLTLPMTRSIGHKPMSEAQAFGLAAVFHLSLLAAALLAANLPKPEIEPPRPIEVRLVQAERPMPTPAPPVEIQKPQPKPVVKRQQEPPRPVTQAPQPMQQAAPPAPAEPQATPAPQPAPIPYAEAIFNAAYLNNPKPIYPPAARRRGDTGTVFLRVQVSETGMALAVEIKQSSGSEHLDRSARETVANWKFVPAKRGSANVASWVVVPVKFSLNDE